MISSYFYTVRNSLIKLIREYTMVKITELPTVVVKDGSEPLTSSNNYAMKKDLEELTNSVGLANASFEAKLKDLSAEVTDDKEELRIFALGVKSNFGVVTEALTKYRYAQQQLQSVVADMCQEQERQAKALKKQNKYSIALVVLLVILFAWDLYRSTH